MKNETDKIESKQQKPGQNEFAERDPRGLFFVVQIVFVVLAMFQIWNGLLSVCQKEQTSHPNTNRNGLFWRGRAAVFKWITTKRRAKVKIATSILWHEASSRSKPERTSRFQIVTKENIKLPWRAHSGGAWREPSSRPVKNTPVYLVEEEPAPSQQLNEHQRKERRPVPAASVLTRRSCHDVRVRHPKALLDLKVKKRVSALLIWST